ncbi:MAG: bacterioferritin-associated ferredoxin [Myxococcota bacterium]
MIVCSCKAVTCRAIRSAVRNGASDLRAVRKASGACTGCGQCRLHVAEIIADEAASSARWANRLPVMPFQATSAV